MSRLVQRCLTALFVLFVVGGSVSERARRSGRRVFLTTTAARTKRTSAVALQ